MRALPPSLALALALPLSIHAAPPAAHALSGDWRITGPSVGKAKGADMGELRVDPSGSYQWLEKGHLAGLGALKPHRPSGGARSGQDCWLVQRGKGDLYFFQDGTGVEVYDAASNTLVGTGAKSGAKRK